MKFYDLLVKHIKIGGLINSIFKLLNDNNKAGIEFDNKQQYKPFIGYDKTNNELVGSNDGITFFPLYSGQGLPLVVEKTAINDTLTVSTNDGFPVGIISPNNIIIPVQKETIFLVDDNYVINLPAYVIYAGLKNNDGIWKVYVASGARGSKGDPGEQGIQGEKGEKGDNALSVTTPTVETLNPESDATADVSMDENGVVTFKFGIPKGSQGEKGEQGIQGEKGEQGIQGEKGEKGEKGEQGIQGEKGEQGDPISLEVGSVVGGEYPSVELVGDSTNQIINFVIPSFFDSAVNVSSSNNNTISVPTNSIPVMLKTNNEKYYNIKGSEITLNENKTNFVIDISNALAINNMSVFEGNWTVYYAGGAKQFSNVPFHPSVNGVGDFSELDSEIFLETYFVEANSMDIYIKSEKNGNLAVKIYSDNVELKTEILNCNTSISKKKINFNNPTSGMIKIVRDYDNELDTLKDVNVNIYKIEG